jgi:hypothetical protein
MSSNGPINLNLARIVVRLLTNQKGWRVDSLQSALEIRPRTYRKYRKLLTEEFEPFVREDGTPIIEEVTEGEAKYLRLVDIESTAASDADFVPRIAAMYFAQQLMGFLKGTKFQDAFHTLFQNFTHALADRPFVLNHLLRNADRIFYQVPDAPKDYSGHREELQTIAHALIFSKVLEVRYDSPTYGELDLVLHPYSLMSYRSGLYLVALSEKHENDDPRIYSVDRIREVTKLERGFEYPSPARFRPETYTEGSFGIFRGDPTRKYRYELIFDDVRWLKMYLREREWHPTQRFDELADGRLRLTFEVSATDEVERWIRSFGDEVEVVADGVEID